MMKKTIMVTGGTGYIGSWVVKGLLEKGNTVRLMVRDKNKTVKFDYLSAIAEKTDGNLEIWEADLLQSGSYNNAALGCEVVVHLASPFLLKFKNPQTELIDPALKGTQNVLNAATKSGTVKKVVLTSSVAAIYGDNVDMQTKGLTEFNESHFNETSSVKHQPYSYSKVLAEKEAWKISEAQSQWNLAVINPSFVMGPPLGISADSGSLSFMNDMLTGKLFLGVPSLVVGFVDVRDIATAHILALENDAAKGRHIISENTRTFLDFAKIIKQEFGGKFKLPFMESPKFMLYLIGGLFGLTASYIKNNVGFPLKFNNSKSKTALGLSYTPMNKTVRDMVERMKELGII